MSKEIKKDEVILQDVEVYDLLATEILPEDVVIIDEEVQKENEVTKAPTTHGPEEAIVGTMEEE